MDLLDFALHHGFESSESFLWSTRANRANHDEDQKPAHLVLPPRRWVARCAEDTAERATLFIQHFQARRQTEKMAADDDAADAAAKAERKRKRLEAWRRKQAEQQAAAQPPADAAVAADAAPPEVAAPPVPAPVKKKVTVSLGLGFAGKKKKKSKTKSKPKLKTKPALLLADDEGDEADTAAGAGGGEEEKVSDPGLLWDPTSASSSSGAAITAAGDTTSSTAERKMDPPHPTDNGDEEGPPRKRSRRWDAGQSVSAAAGKDTDKSGAEGAAGGMDDALDKFMDQLEVLPTGQVTALDVDVGGSMQRANAAPASSEERVRAKANVNAVGGSGGVITAAELERLQQGMGGKKNKASESESAGQPLFTHSDWESDVPTATHRQADESASEVRTTNTLHSAPLIWIA